MLTTKHWAHQRPCILAAFAVSITLGAVTSFYHRHEPGVARARPSTDGARAGARQSAPASGRMWTTDGARAGASRDTAADSVRAMPEYKRACAARERGQYARAAEILSRLAHTRGLSEPQRAFCRQELERLRR